MTSASSPTADISSPEAWWRQLCWVTPQVALCGDLPEQPSAALRQLDEWVDAGITHILDVRWEATDASFVATHAPEITYLWHGVDDHGRRQPDHWFAEAVQAATTALSHPDAKVVVHCHMGVNRGPSMGLAILLAIGHDPIGALTAIRTARPIADVLYAVDAVDWWHRHHGADDITRRTARREIERWRRANPVDTSWVISRIRRAGG